MVRTMFDSKLIDLNNEMTVMGALCEEAIKTAVKALVDYDAAAEKSVRESCVLIDRKEKQIENICLKLLLHEQPVARDLRTVTAALKMIYDMERIGDQAEDVAQTAKYITKSDRKGKTQVNAMGEAAAKMVTRAIDSFVKRDLLTAKEVIDADDEVDDAFNRVKKELCELMKKGETDAEGLLDVLMAAKYIERIADHAVNIAYWVEYLITGVHSDSLQF